MFESSTSLSAGAAPLAANPTAFSSAEPPLSGAGAVFIDGGFESARSCIIKVLPDNPGEIVYKEETINYKSLLQEYIQALHKIPPRYRVYSTAGPDHDKEFDVEVVVQGNILGKGAGKTKKHAEQEAAKAAYRRLMNAPDDE